MFGWRGSWIRSKGLGSRVEKGSGLIGLGVQSSGRVGFCFKVQVEVQGFSGIRAQGLRFRIEQGLVFRVYGLGFKPQG